MSNIQQIQGRLTQASINNKTLQPPDESNINGGYELTNHKYWNKSTDMTTKHFKHQSSLSFDFQNKYQKQKHLMSFSSCPDIREYRGH